MISFDITFTSEKDIDLQVVRDCLYKVIASIKVGEISDNSFQRAKLSAITAIKKKNEIIMPLDPKFRIMVMC